MNNKSNDSPRRIKLTIAYDGTNYFGWQVQRSALSIQTLVQSSLERILRHPISLTGAGRTDAGVHAEGQTAHFDTSVPLSLARIRLSANALLPPDIRILNAEEVPSDFHARYSAQGKIYHYYLTTAPDPTTRLYRTPIFGTFDMDALKIASLSFLGTHDFAAFANSAHKGTAAHDSIRTLSRLDLYEQDGSYRLEFEGDGFLYKMVRNITGTLLEVARGQRCPKSIPALIAGRDRKQAGPTAPPQGLFLMRVLYRPKK